MLSVPSVSAFTATSLSQLTILSSSEYRKSSVESVVTGHCFMMCLMGIMSDHCFAIMLTFTANTVGYKLIYELSALFVLCCVVKTLEAVVDDTTEHC